MQSGILRCLGTTLFPNAMTLQQQFSALPPALPLGDERALPEQSVSKPEGDLVSGREKPFEKSESHTTVYTRHYSCFTFL